MDNPVKILIAEQDPVDVELLHHELKTGGVIYVSEIVQNERDYLNALRNFIPDIILADYAGIKNLLSDLLLVHPIKIQFHNIKLDEATLDKKLQLTIFRIVQEQAKNILKHPKRTSATITLNKGDNEVILPISDNGEGTGILKKVDGVGIRNIKSRGDLHNGRVRIVSKQGRGMN